MSRGRRASADGQRLRLSPTAGADVIAASLVRVYEGSRLLGMAHWQDGLLSPQRLIGQAHADRPATLNEAPGPALPRSGTHS
jgi:hypothetical protein